jgi:hypothetical protein
MKSVILKLSVIAVITVYFSSCSVSLPSFRRTNVNTDISVNSAVSQVEPLKREDYDVLGPTKGSAGTSKFYVLFIPLGKHKTNNELYENAYYNAVDNLPNADALILTRQKNKKLIVPLILINYFRREVEVSGVGISVKGKINTTTSNSN